MFLLWDQDFLLMWLLQLIIVHLNLDVQLLNHCLLKIKKEQEMNNDEKNKSLPKKRFVFPSDSKTETTPGLSTPSIGT